MSSKETIPRAMKRAVWEKYMGKKYEGNCWVRWCNNTISVWDFHTGHNIPESKGGKLSIENLRPICAHCNTSMGDR